MRNEVTLVWGSLRLAPIRYARMHTKSAHVVLLSLCCACGWGKGMHMLGARFQSMSDDMESLAMPGQGMSRTY